ncbi:MAG: guanylate kinase [Proteobacteria bacterium]|nr:guanylate kinase [Pseudomonadota bacterium]
MRKGHLFVISAPSGAGKSTVLDCVRRRIGNLEFSVSCTTRPIRAGESEGVHYRFVDESVFRAMIDRGEFLEWAEVHGELYGTPRLPIEGAIAAGRDVLLDIDVQGGMAIKRSFPEAVTVFLLPPSMGELKSRLGGRATDSPEQIRVRLANAEREMGFAERYDRRVVNDEVERACGELCALIEASRKAKRG